jgi:DNA mismatch endonuclease (patch repair protein)
MGLTRSEQMSRIRGEDTSPERVLGAALRERGLDFDEHAKTPVGRPDIVFSTLRVAVFIDGCFWHGCPTHYVRPRTKTEFWSNRLRENVARDRTQTRDLEALGWAVVRVWEHEVFTALDAVISRIEERLAGDDGEHDDGWRVLRVDLLDPATDLERRHMVTLRDPAEERFEDVKRYTTKWRIPKAK